MRKLLIAVLLLSAAAFAQDPSAIGGSQGAQQVFNGFLYANAFGTWSVPQGDVGQFTWSNPHVCENPTGVTFNLFSVGLPIKIIDADVTKNETTTITAVVKTGFQCSIVTAPLTFSHFSFRIVSGTLGLQEALNYAIQRNLNTTVFLTNAWTMIGGTTGMITSAVGNANIGIADERSPLHKAYAWNGSAYIQQGLGGFGITSIDAIPIGPNVPSTGVFTSLSSTSGALNGSIGATTPAPGSFTDLITSSTPVVDVRSKGAKCDNSTDDTIAIQAAIDAATASPFQRDIAFPPGRCKVTSTLQINARGMHFKGVHGFRPETEGGSSLEYYGTGPLIQLGTDNGHAHDAADYDGIQGFVVRDMELRYSGASTSSLSNGQGVYGTGTYAIQDWRGGSIVLRDSTIEHFNYGFWGIQSDFDVCDNVAINYNEVGMYFGPRSDQAKCQVNSLFNDQALWIDGAHNTDFSNSHFVDDGSNTTAPIRIGATLTQPAYGFSCKDCWLEHQGGYNGTINAFIAAGTGDTVQSSDINLIRPIVQNNAAGGFHTNYLIEADNVARVRIEHPFGPFSANLSGFVNATGTNSPDVNAYRDSSFGFAIPTVINSGSGSPTAIDHILSGTHYVIRAGGLNSDQTLDIDSGSSAAKSSCLRLTDREFVGGSAQWAICKASDGTFQIQDLTNSSLVRFLLNAGASAISVLNASGSGQDVRINASANTGTGGLSVYNGAATPAKQSALGGDGSISFGGNTSFANFGKISPAVAFTAQRTILAPDSTSSLVLSGSITTTAVTSEAFTIQGIVSGNSHCGLTATNASAATNIATTFISATGTNSITVTHTATASMTYNVLCTAN